MYEEEGKDERGIRRRVGLGGEAEREDEEQEETRGPNKKQERGKDRMVDFLINSRRYLLPSGGAR